MILNARDSRKGIKRLLDRFPCDFDVEIYNPVVYRTDKACAYNFSAGGLGVFCVRALPIHDKVRLRMLISKKIEPIVHEAQVVWAKQQKTGLWRIGLKFLGAEFSGFSSPRQNSAS